MLSKLKILKLISHRFPLRNTNNNGPCCFFYNNPLCTMVESRQTTESPEIPGWVKFSDSQTPENADSDEDFVIPSLADWVNTRMLHSDKKIVRPKLIENKESDVEAISNILKKRYQSPEKVAESLNGYGFLLSNSLVEQILKRFSNDWTPALGLFTWAKEQAAYRHSPDLYNFMIDILGKSKKFNLMWELVEEMNQHEGYVTLMTMTKVIRRLAKAGKHEDAIVAFRKADQFGVNKDTALMNALMDALVKGDSVEHAHNVLLEFKNLIPLNEHCFNVLIHGWCKARKLDQGHKEMDDMKEHGFKPDVVSYTSFIEAYCREKDFRKADKILDKMKENGCSPNVVSYTILMHALGKAGQLNEALEVYTKMKCIGCVPDAAFYSSLINMLGRAGRLNDVREVFEDMPKQGVMPDSTTYNAMIAIACAHSQEETALMLLKEMEENSSKPTLETYHPLLKMCCRKKRMKVLNFLLDHMFRNDLSLEVGTYTLLVHGLCKSGKLERACSFFEEMVSHGLAPKDITVKVLAEALERKSMLKEKEHIEILTAQSQIQNM